MNADQLKSIQAPLKQQYKDDPNAAVVTLSAEGHATGLSCNVATGKAEGDLDFRGTLGVAKDAPVGFRDIRLRFTLDTDAPEDQRATRIRLTERYGVVPQTLRQPPPISVV